MDSESRASTAHCETGIQHELGLDYKHHTDDPGQVTQKVRASLPSSTRVRLIALNWVAQESECTRGIDCCEHADIRVGFLLWDVLKILPSESLVLVAERTHNNRPSQYDSREIVEQDRMRWRPSSEVHTEPQKLVLREPDGEPSHNYGLDSTYCVSRSTRSEPVLGDMLSIHPVGRNKHYVVDYGTAPQHTVDRRRKTRVRFRWARPSLGGPVNELWLRMRMLRNAQECGDQKTMKDAEVRVVGACRGARLAMIKVDERTEQKEGLVPGSQSYHDDAEVLCLCDIRSWR
nr:hypothetical protein CFP56_00261 [Quercus suber]